MFTDAQEEPVPALPATVPVESKEVTSAVSREPEKKQEEAKETKTIETSEKPEKKPEDSDSKKLETSCELEATAAESGNAGTHPKRTLTRQERAQCPFLMKSYMFVSSCPIVPS